tara:strand:- start:8902 stop:11985 length:3084 start_codon:yes stop_codon:yes gene_type:complete
MASDRKKEQEEINSLLSEESSALEKILGLQNDVKNMMQQKLQLKNKELQEQKSLTQFIQSGLDIETKRVQNARDLSQLGNRILQGKVQAQALDDANLASAQAQYDAANKRKLINDASYQQGLLDAELKDGIVSMEEEILGILRDKKKLEDPAFKAKQEELTQLKKKEEFQKKSQEHIDYIKDKFDDVTALATDPKIAMTVFGGVMLNNASKFANTMTEVGADMGVSRDQALEMGAALGPASIQAFAMGISAKKIAEAYSGIAESMGPMTPQMAGMATHAAKMAKELQIAPKEAGKLFALTAMIEGGTAETAKASLKTVENLARGANVPIGAVMSDVANSADLIAQYGYDNVEALGKAAVEAAKMGTSLDQMAKTADKLMDIDNARNNAMQLSVLLGRNINIDRAQQLIYEGKLEEGYKEMLNQLGGINAFNQMDYYQKKQAADLMGVSVGELQKQLNLQAGLTETGEKQATGWAKILGNVKDGAKFAKDNMTTLASTLSVLGSIKNMKIATWIKEKAHAIWMKTFGGGSKVAQAAAGPLKADGTPDMRFKANKGLISKIQKPVDSGNKLTDKMAKTPKKQGNVITRFFNSFKKVNWSSIAKGIVAMLGMAVALVAFVPPFKMLADVPVQGILAGIGSILVLSQTIGAMGKGSTSTMKGAATMAIMAAALLPMALSMQMIAGINQDAMWNFTGIATVLGLVFAGIGALGAATITGAFAMILMASSMIPMAYSMQMIEGLSYADMWNFTAVLTVLGLVFSGIGYLALLPVGALGMMMMAAAMIPMAYSFQMVNGLPFADMWNFTGVLSALGLVFSILGGFPGIFVGALALLMMGPAMIAIVYAMKSFAGLDWKAALDVGKTIGMLALSVAGVGLMYPLVIAGSVAMLMASAGLMAFGLAMKQIPTDLLQGQQMLMMAAGMGAMGAAGVSMLFGAPGFFAMSAGLIVFAGALALIAPLLPVVEKLAQLGIIGNMEGAEGAGGAGGGDEGENAVIEKLDELISLIRSGGKVVMDGREVGKVVQMAIGPQGS